MYGFSTAIGKNAGPGGYPSNLVLGATIVGKNFNSYCDYLAFKQPGRQGATF
jgi:hypothetical protein